LTKNGKIYSKYKMSENQHAVGLPVGRRGVNYACMQVFSKKLLLLQKNNKPRSSGHDESDSTCPDGRQIMI
jgi:hypothetical protein